LGLIVRRLVVVIAALGLAAGGILGFAAPAGADDPFSAAVESPASIVAGSTDPLVFGGSKDAGAVITDVTVDNPTAADLTASVCSNGGTGNTTWSCTYTPTSGYVEASASSIQIDYTNVDGSSSQAVITFDVATAPAPASSPDPTSTSGPTSTPDPTITSGPTSTPDPTITSGPTSTPDPTTTPTPAPSSGTPLSLSAGPAPIVVVPAPATRNLAVVSTFAAPNFVATIAGSTDPSFTAEISSPTHIIADEATDVVLAGTKSANSELVDISENQDAIESVNCTGRDTGSTEWSCTIALDALDQGDYSFDILEQNSDGTVLQNVLTFTVYPDTDGASGPIAPEVAYEFAPAAATVVAVPTGNGSAVATQIVQVGEGPAVINTCPDDAGEFGGEGGPLGANPLSRLTCTGTGLTPSNDGGPYVVVTGQGATSGEGFLRPSGETSNGVFWVPENDLGNDPAVPTTVTENPSTRTVTVTGSISNDETAATEGESSSPQGAVEILDSNGDVVCFTQNFSYIDDESYSSSFSCTTSELSYGTHRLTAAIADEGEADYEEIGYAVYEKGLDHYQYVLGALSSASTVGTFDFPAPQVPVTITDTTPIWTFTVTGNLQPGGTITISGAGLPPGTSVDTILHSVPTDLGTVVAAGDGTFTKTVTIPADEPVGAHTILVTASGPGLVTTTQQQPITLTAAPASNTGGTSTAVLPKTAHGSGITSSGSGTAIQPNILTSALTPIADVAVHPSKIVSAIEIGLVLLLLAVLPAHLLNATIAEQSDRFERRFKRFPKRPRWVTSLIAWFSSAPVVAGIIVTLATAILFGFADPRFGFTLASLRLILACGIALFLVGYVANALTGVIARNQWHITVLVSTRPYGLILTVVGVLISRLLHFSPGFLIGLILGLTIQGKSAAGFAWRTVVTRTCIVLAMAIAAWIGYSTLTLGGNEGGTFGSALLVETLVAITTEGIVALLVELLPLRFLEGERVYAHSRVLWGVLYFLTVVVFVLGVVPWEGNWDALGNTLWIWIGVLLVFAAICVGIYIYFRRFAKPLEEDGSSEEVALGETVSGDRS
jgi:hypothetical protein